MSTSNDTSIQGTGSVWASKGFVFGACFLTAVIVSLVFVLASLMGRGASPAPQASQAPTDPVVPASEEALPPMFRGACETGVGDMSVLTAAPATRDASFVGVTVAASEELGPSRTTGDLPTCYEHSSAGALVAGANFLRLQAQYSDQMKLFETVVAPSDMRTAALEDMRAAGGAMRGWTPGVLIIKGFAMEVWADDTVFVSYAATVPASGPQIVTTQLTMRWVDGDWKVLLPEQGISVSTIASLAEKGMIEWSVPSA